MDWKDIINSVIHAGFTDGMITTQSVINSLAPSRLADSMRDDGICSIKFFIRYHPNVDEQAGNIIAQYVSIKPNFEIIM